MAKTVILSNMRTTVGEVYSAASVEEDVRNLYATGFFTNLAIKDEPLGDGVRVNVVVQPKPLVKEIVITGAKKIKESRVKKEIKSKAGEPLSEQMISADADKIKDLYLGKGYNQVQVSYKIDTNEEFGRSVVTFIVSEGERAYVTEVDFIGNDHLTTKELRKIMKTRKKNLLSFLNKSGLYKDDDFKTDLDNLRTYYNSKGYIDMEVKDVKNEYPEQGLMKVTITVFEGIQYTVGKIDFTGNTIFTKQELRNYRGDQITRMDEGKVYAPRAYTPDKKEPNEELPTLDNDIKRMNDLYGTRGYIDREITPERQANVESGKIDILTTSPRVRSRTSSRSSSRATTAPRTRSSAVNCSSHPVRSTTASASMSARSASITFSTSRRSTFPRRTPPFRIARTWSSRSRKSGPVRSRSAPASARLTVCSASWKSRRATSISSTSPTSPAAAKSSAFVSSTVSSVRMLKSSSRSPGSSSSASRSVTISSITTPPISPTTTTREITAPSVSLSRAFGQFWSGSITYTLQQYELYDFVSNSPLELLREQGYRSDSSITLGMSYDTRDSVLLTRRGMHADFSAEFAGGPLLGQTSIYKFQANAQKYILLPYDMILTIAAATGVADYYNDNSEVPLFDRFFIGGSRSVRGFGNRDIGPKSEELIPVRIAATRNALGQPTSFKTVYELPPTEPLGGDTMFYQNTELTFPIMDRVRGAIFNDVGYLDAVHSTTPLSCPS